MQDIRGINNYNKRFRTFKKIIDNSYNEIFEIHESNNTIFYINKEEINKNTFDTHFFNALANDIRNTKLYIYIDNNSYEYDNISMYMNYVSYLYINRIPIYLKSGLRVKIENMQRLKAMYIYDELLENYTKIKIKNCPNLKLIITTPRIPCQSIDYGDLMYMTHNCYNDEFNDRKRRRISYFGKK